VKTDLSEKQHISQGPELIVKKRRFLRTFPFFKLLTVSNKSMLSRRSNTAVRIFLNNATNGSLQEAPFGS
jgi:hypothetical protein